LSFVYAKQKNGPECIQGSNRLVRPDSIGDAVQEVISGDWPSGSCPELWDGETAARVVQSLRARSKRRQ
jgi:UDP-N-acetylglucosamine 2-epimerase (non-hydrolysing)